MTPIVLSAVFILFFCFTTILGQWTVVPIDDFYIVEYGNGTFVSLCVHENDGPIGGSPWPASQADHGSVIMAYGDTCLHYSPPAGYFGIDTFKYRYRTQIYPVETWSSTATAVVLVIPNDDAQNAGASCPIVGKPVNVTNGNMWLEQTDYSLPGRGEAIEISRFYNSVIQRSGLFGFGWSTKYDESIEIFGDKMIRFNQSDGRAAYFGRRATTDLYFSFSSDVAAKIAQNPDGTYTLTYKDGILRNFSSSGKLVSMGDRNGNVTSLAYDTNSRLTGITDAAGRTLTLTPNANGTVTQISDSLGTVADYEYFKGTSLLKTVTYADGSKFKFEYTEKTVNGQTRTLLATMKDALDNIIETHEYDSIARATTSEKQGGVEKYTFAYDQYDGGSNKFYTLVTDALGRTTKYFADRIYGTNVISKIVGNCSCGGSGSETTTYNYDTSSSWLNLIKKTDALGRETTYNYDDDRNITEEVDTCGTQKWTYSSFGQVLTYKDRVDSGGATNTAVLTYDANGNLKTYTDALGKVTMREYPATNNVGLPDSIKDARNNITKFKWFAGSGLLDEIEDPYSKKTKFTYDVRGRTKTVTNALNYITQYNYFDDTNRKVEMIYPNLDKITYKYDSRRLLESVIDERGKITAYEFDQQYRLKKVTDPLLHTKEFGYDLMSNMTSYKDALGNETNYVFDDFNRLKKITHPALVVGGTRLSEEFEYDKLGRMLRYYDTANRLRLYSYDELTRTNTVTNAENEVTTTKYNQRFQTIEVKDAINQVYAFSYDPLGRLLSQTRAGGTMSFEYDEAGNRKQRIDYMGRVTDYTFDNLNRLTKTEYRNGDTNPVDKQKSIYAYDEISRLTSAANEAGTVSFNYDNRNRVTSTTDVFGKVLAYEYERTLTVNQKRLKLDNALYATYIFDDAGRLANIVNASDSSIITYGYDNEDKVISRAYPNGVTTTYEYYNNDLLKRLKDFNSSNTFFDRQYTYNSANQIDTLTELTGTRSFGYDLTDRLKTVAVGGTQTEFYNYDHVGNRTSSHLSATYGYQTGKFNQLTLTASATYKFDANGNTVQKSEGPNFWRYTRDNENRLTQASTRKQSVRYKYDALGRLVQRFTPGSKENTKFVNDGSDVLLDDHAGTLTKYLNGSGIDDKLRVQSGSDVKYFLSDHLGSTNGLADSSGIVTSQTAYDSFGKGTNSNFPSRYQFTGREFDTFSGLQYSRSRFYDPNIGRFTAEDPIGFGGGDANLYSYVRNQPLNFRDARGLFPDGDVVNPDTVRNLGPVATALAALAWPELGVAAVGAGAIYGASLIGDYTANHPANPFVNGPLNPFGNPYPDIRPLPPTMTSPTSSPTSRPYCKPQPRMFPFPNGYPLPYSIPLGPTNPPRNPEKEEECFNRCQHLLGRRGDLQSMEFTKCYRSCMGSLW